MRLIQKTDLETWAGTYEAKGRFPHIVKKLICEVVSPSQLQMPSGAGVWLPGYDGEVASKEKSRFVPTGLSVWEVGTEPNPKSKAQSDYDKRKKNAPKSNKKGKVTPQSERHRPTFVFVTPRWFKGKKQWVTERKKDDIWDDVKVIDVLDLLDWLDAAPATYLQFAYELGILPEEGLQSPDQAWEQWRHLTNPPTSEELVVLGREEQKQLMIGRLIGSPSIFAIRGDSPREALGFALAALRLHTPAEEQFSLHARTIVADDEKVAGILGNRSNLKDHIIVLKQAHDQVSGVLSYKGCHVIVPLGNEEHPVQNPVILARPTHHEFAEALERMGLKDGESERVSRECGRSITILQRLWAHANAKRPRWADGDKVVHLLPALLAGRWNDQSEADRKILCQIADVTDYASVEQQLKHFRRVDEPPLQKVGEMWTLTAPVDAFQLTARHLTVAHLGRFKDAFRAVFGRIDPKVDIPLDEWIYQDVKGERGHSGWLRAGMAETLLLIAERGASAQLDCVPSSGDYADAVVRGLPGLNDDWRLLASIRDQYPRLMEAAPIPFLDSLEHLLEAKPDDMRRLFAEGQMMFASPMHTGLLWGLEIMAWNPEYLPRIALILAKLAGIDPGGRWVNRPINSLREIFLWWHPGTTATIDQRLAAIDLVLERHPDIGWDLVVKLLPMGLSTTSGTAKPRWRDIGKQPEDSRTRHGQAEYTSAIGDRALNLVDLNPERWHTILDMLRVFNTSQQEKALHLLNTIAQNPGSTHLKVALWQILRGFIAQHRTYQEANWALTRDLVDRLETILPNLAPVEPIERNRWLFDDWVPGLPSGEENIEQRRKQVEELRKQAVREILNTQGVEGLVTLGTTCKYPGFVASAAVPLMPNLAAVRDFVQHAVSAGEAGILLASQISGQVRELYGEAWRDLIYKETKDETWSPDVIGSLLMWWPDRKVTWDDAEALGVVEEYWRRKPVFLIQGTQQEQSYQIDHLIEVGRAAEVFNFVSHWGKETQTDTLVRLFDAALSELFQAQTIEEVRRIGVNPHGTREFLDELRSRSDLPREELARREYRALPLLGLLNVEGLTLHEFMAEDPNFFISVLCDAFLPAHRDKSEDAEPTPEVQARAQAAFTLLKGMVRIPGQRANNRIDEETLLQWVNAVRKSAADVDRAAIADQQIGHILAHSSEDPDDGSWPHQVVRNMIEKLAADDIDQGLIVERINMRGISSKAMYEGGAQERLLASRYHSLAEISLARWPRMARVLEVIAQVWEDHARREDERAEQAKLE